MVLLFELCDLQKKKKKTFKGGYQAKQGGVVEFMFKMIMIGPLYIHVYLKKIFAQYDNNI